MDKETLSNYGWIVIAVLVLAVMIALASPFGHFIENGVKSTAQGLFDVNQSAGAIAGLDIPNQEFDVPNGGAGENGGVGETPVVPGITFDSYLTNPACHQYKNHHVDNCYTFETTTLTWNELKLEENANKFNYNASNITDAEIKMGAFSHNPITNIVLPDSLIYIREGAFMGCVKLSNIDLSKCRNLIDIEQYAFANCTSIENLVIPSSVTSIGWYAFSGCTNLKSITIPTNIPSIGDYAFSGCKSLSNITFNGTIAQWNEVWLEEGWNENVPATYVQCSDGTVPLS